MKKKLINLVLLLLILVSCDNSSRSTRKKVAHRVISGVIKTLETRHNMKCISLGEGGGGVPGYNFIGLGFIKQEVISKDEGRRILIESVNELLNEINNDPELQEYLLVHPFTEKNVDINFMIKNNKKNVYYPDIMAFSAYGGAISYRTKSPEERFGFKTNEHETFEEAVNIVESQKQFAE